MKRTNLYLTEKQLERLQDIAHAEGLALAEVVRRAVDAYLAWNDPTYAPTHRTPEGRAIHPPLRKRGLSGPRV